MQIDFHHTVTYVVARTAGFNHQDADIIAYSAQYVDDAVKDRTVLFEDKSMYSHISSAHKVVDYKNLLKRSNHMVWIPFHFLPGNEGKKAGENQDEDFVKKIICKPDSHVAQDMIHACIQDKDSDYALHRLGITMHVLADTWAHQEFAGINDKINKIERLHDDDEFSFSLFQRFKNLVGDIFDVVKSSFVGETLPLGHATALTHPDLPYQEWSYLDSSDEKKSRNNPDEFTKAACGMYQAMLRFRQGDSKADVEELSEEMQNLIKDLFKKFTNEDGEKRHEQWLKTIKEGYFPFEVEPLEYHEKGPGSWEAEALGSNSTILANFSVCGPMILPTLTILLPIRPLIGALIRV